MSHWPSWRNKFIDGKVWYWCDRPRRRVSVDWKFKSPICSSFKFKVQSFFFSRNNKNRTQILPLTLVQNKNRFAGIRGNPKLEVNIRVIMHMIMFLRVSCDSGSFGWSWSFHEVCQTSWLGFFCTLCPLSRLLCYVGFHRNIGSALPELYHLAFFTSYYTFSHRFWQ